MNLRYNIPRTFQEALARFNSMLDELTETDRREWLAMDEGRAVGMPHHGLGQQLRNEWGLWHGSPLKTDMERIGFTHPDDMSSAIMRCVHRMRNNRDMDVQGQVRVYQEYWSGMTGEVSTIEMISAAGDKFKVTTFKVPQSPEVRRVSRYDIAKE